MYSCVFFDFCWLSFPLTTFDCSYYLVDGSNDVGSGTGTQFSVHFPCMVCFFVKDDWRCMDLVRG